MGGFSSRQLAEGFSCCSDTSAGRISITLAGSGLSCFIIDMSHVHVRRSAPSRPGSRLEVARGGRLRHNVDGSVLNNLQSNCVAQSLRVDARSTGGAPFELVSIRARETIEKGTTERKKQNWSLKIPVTFEHLCPKNQHESERVFRVEPKRKRQIQLGKQLSLPG